MLNNIMRPSYFKSTLQGSTSKRMQALSEIKVCKEMSRRLLYGKVGLIVLAYSYRTLVDALIYTTDLIDASLARHR